MVNTFSNSKLCIPKGFQSLLVGLSTEVLRSQPRNIPAFAADYFEKLLQRREQGQFDLSEEQETNFEDRYHNNRSFQNEYPVNHPDVDTAATKIQAQFRGHLVRRDLDKIKHENKDDVTSDQEEEEEEANDDEKDQTLSYDEQLQQEHAAISIQAQYRGYQVRKHLQELTDHNEQDIHQIPDTNRFNDQFEAGENNQVPLGRELTQLSEDFERHTQIPRDSNFDREVHEQYFNESDDDDDNNMNNSPLDQAATRIQASYRGYKTRKELGTISNHSHTGQGHGDEIHNKNILSPSAEGNKVLANDDEDNEAAAVKIQAAYRGYRVRKELEK